MRRHDLFIELGDELRGDRIVDGRSFDEQRRLDMAERERPWRRTVTAQEVESFLCLVEARDVPVGNPPQHDVCLGRHFEELAPSPEDREVIALIDERLEALDRLPHREVHDHIGIGIGPDAVSVAFVGLQSPYVSG